MPNMSGTPTYHIWEAMKDRCLNPRSRRYPGYGGRGITVCDRWLTFSNFLDDMGERPDGRSIERIDNDGNYEPGNCRWATSAEQARNTRRTRFLTIDGRTQCAVDWALEVGVNPMTVYGRLFKGWSDRDAVFGRSVSPRNTSGVTGVHPNKRTGRWIAQVKLAGRTHHVGTFDTVEDAVMARRIFLAANP